MVTTRIELDQVAGRLPELVDEVSAGAEIVITRGNHPVARLVGYTKPRRMPRFGSAKDLITISEDFDEPLEEFEEYMQ